MIFQCKCANTFRHYLNKVYFDVNIVPQSNDTLTGSLYDYCVSLYLNIWDDFYFISFETNLMLHWLLGQICTLFETKCVLIQFNSFWRRTQWYYLKKQFVLMVCWQWTSVYRPFLMCTHIYMQTLTPTLPRYTTCW